jgi:CRISPR-associated protein Cas1
MTRELLNTLYVQSPGAYVRRDGETLRVEVENRTAAQVPLHHLGAVVLFGRTGMSGEAMPRCAAEGRMVTLLDAGGRFQARVVGPTSGNVLLRKAQYDAHADPERTRKIARLVVAGKVRSSRNTILRAAREAKNEENAASLRGAAGQMATMLEALAGATQIEQVRGIEGQSAAAYFIAFPLMIAAPTEEFAFRTRSRRPPRDRTNALLSFLYSLLTTDCTAAVEGVGLDPQFGYLHVLRPGRPALALDLVEEFRSCLADRLVLTLINRRQIRPAVPGPRVRLRSAGSRGWCRVRAVHSSSQPVA